MHKKYHEKFKILDILAVTTQAREGIETTTHPKHLTMLYRNNSSPWGHWNLKPDIAELIQPVTTQAREGIETMKISFQNSDEP